MSKTEHLTRTIKFRAFDKRNDVMRSWDECKRLDYTTQFSLFEDENYIWLQNTGLLDRNGKEIYEGDILRVQYNSIGDVTITFRNGCFNASQYDLKRCTVIGNVYELLTQNATSDGTGAEHVATTADSTLSNGDTSLPSPDELRNMTHREFEERHLGYDTRDLAAHKELTGTQNVVTITEVAK